MNYLFNGYLVKFPKPHFNIIIVYLDIRFELLTTLPFFVLMMEINRLEVSFPTFHSRRFLDSNPIPLTSTWG